MTSNKKFLQQLKRPDTFQAKAMGYFDWIEKHKMRVAGLMGAALIVCAGYFAWKYVGNIRSEKRRHELASIDFHFDAESEIIAKEQQKVHAKVGELEQKIENLSKDNGKTTNATTLAKLETEKKSLEASMEAMKPNHDATREQYLAYYQANKTNIEGWRAGLQVTTIDIEQKKYAEAADLLKEILPKAKGSYFYDMQVRATYISLLEELGKYPEALNEAEDLIKIADDGMMPRALLIKGRLLLLNERKGEAKEVFNKIITEHNTSYEAGKAKAYNLL